MKLQHCNKLLLRLLLLMLLGLILLFWVVNGWPCLLRKITGLPCLSCGMSRAWLSAFRLDWAGAFTYHPMFWSIPVLAVLWLFIDRIPKGWLTGISMVIALGYFVCYIIRIIGFFAGEAV